VRTFYVSVPVHDKQRHSAAFELHGDSAAYEGALKSRPAPWNVRISSQQARKGSGTSVRVQIGFNAVSLCQRAFGLLPKQPWRQEAMLQSNGANRRCIFEWRIVSHTEEATMNCQKMKFTSNKGDPEAEQPPNFEKFELRKEQRRSLSWMLQQERSTVPFMEEEVCENVLPFNWRGEGRVCRPVLVRVRANGRRPPCGTSQRSLFYCLL
jgi:hypothetical protein